MTVALTLRVNHGNVSHHEGLPVPVARSVGGRAGVTIHVQRLGQPDCEGVVGETLLDSAEGLSNADPGILTLIAQLSSCGDQITAGRFTIDVRATADAHFIDGVLGDTGFLQTVLDVDVLSIDVDVDVEI